MGHKQQVQDAMNLESPLTDFNWGETTTLLWPQLLLVFGFLHQTELLYSTCTCTAVHVYVALYEGTV
jgi:hypothetical protein